MQNIEGIFLKIDFTEFITESFVKRYNVNLSNWISPFGYLEQNTCALVYNTPIPKGTYVLFGKVTYPGKQSLSSHTIYQLNLVKVKRSHIELLNFFKQYVDLPDSIPLNPYFPLFRLGEIKDYKDISKLLKKIEKENFPISQLQCIINKLDPDTVESKLYKLYLAIKLDMQKG